MTPRPWRSPAWTRRRVVAAACGAGAVFACSASESADPVGDGYPDTTGWPSLLDALPYTIKVAVQERRYAGDLTPALRDAIATGDDFVIPPGLYPFAGDAIELGRAGQRIVGSGGMLNRLPQRDGIGFLLSAAGVGLFGLRFDGTAPAIRLSHVNDMVKVTGDGCKIVDLAIRGSAGSNLRIEGARGVRLIRPMLTDAHQNNLIICETPTHDIVVERPVCRRTATQNNIFVTASAGSTDNGAIISGIAIIDPVCTDAGDTGIELGYHCQDSRVTGGTVANSANTPLLQRDGRRNRWERIHVVPRPLAHQHGNYDGVAVVPQWERATWDSDTEFNAVTVSGPVRRSAYYWGQSGIRRIECDALGFETGGSSRAGSGDLKAGDVGNIVVRGGRIDGFVNGDDWNYDAAPHVRRGCITSDVVFTRCDRIFNLYNITPYGCAITDNRGTDNLQGIHLARSSLQPSDAQPNVGLIYDGNVLGVSTAPETDEALLLTRDSRFVRVPARGAVVVMAHPIPGRYRLTVGGGHSDFSITAAPHNVLLRSADTLAAVGIEVTVAKRQLMLQQRSQTAQAAWVKISGPGIGDAEPFDIRA